MGAPRIDPQRTIDDGWGAITSAPRPIAHLTSVNQPRQEMGRLAAQMLRERSAGRTHDAVSVVDPVLTVRSSTGPGPPLRP
ncbi:MAG: substrate-binding domain-containing protein [Brachybacterium sp.]